MNTKNITIAILVTTTILLFLSACNNDEEAFAKPVITLTEVGIENSTIGYPGSDFHLEADLVAEAKISTVKVEIHPEGSSLWEFDTTYTKFSNLKNATFHEHFEISADAGLGAYHLHLIVTDLEGNQTIAESAISLILPNDTVAPTILITSVPSANQVFATAQTISIAGSVSDNMGVGGLYIALVRSDQALADADVNAENTITLLHNHDFEDVSTFNFSSSLVVGAAMDNNTPAKAITWTAGEYYLLVKCQDAFGGNWSNSAHFPITIN
jgi:hypothetical protein